MSIDAGNIGSQGGGQGGGQSGGQGDGQGDACLPPQPGMTLSMVLAWAIDEYTLGEHRLSITHQQNG
jgi:hypothetical protein